MDGRAHVITVSDRASAGKMADESGPALVEILRGLGFEVSGPEVVPDEKELIAKAIVEASGGGAALVVTTGGTGLGPRDVTPQATAPLLDYQVPGLGEAMRQAGAASTPMSSISRSLAGVRGRTLIVNVPGSRRGASESLHAIEKVLPHAIRILQGDPSHP